MFSNTVMRGKIEVIWKLRDRPRWLICCGARPAVSWPLTVICPAVIGIKDGQPRLMTKMLALGGMLWVFHKTEGAVIDLGGDSGVADDAERFVPVETPDPRPLRN